MKTQLPNDIKVARDAKLSMQECAFEFLAFITSEAADKCKSERRKTIAGAIHSSNSLVRIRSLLL
jgi:nuclear transcription Y subunit beta